MSLLSLHFAFIKYSKIPALQNALKAYEEDRLNDALEILRASHHQLRYKVIFTPDLLALIQESRDFIDALADAIETFQNFPHLAIGYNRASEIYVRKGQGLHATEVYEAGLKAIGEEGDPHQRSLLQKHRHEMELKYRDFIALLPLEITEHIFGEFFHDVRVRTFAAVSTAWLPKAVHNVFSATANDDPGPDHGPSPAVASRLWKYIDKLEILTQGESYLGEFFGGLRKEPFVGKWKKLQIEGYRSANHVNLHKTMAPGLTRISQSLASLTVKARELISPMDLLEACPNLTTLKYDCSSCLASVQKTIPQRDKLTHLIVCTKDPYQESFVRDLQSIIKATPNVRFAQLPTAISDVSRVIPQHWRKLRQIYLRLDYLFGSEDEILEAEGFLHIRYQGANLSGLYEYVCQERMRLSHLTIETGATMTAEIIPVQFHVLKYLSINFYGMDESVQSVVLELMRGAVEVLEELVLHGTELPPETYEVLARMPRLERLDLGLPFIAGVHVYLEHLASLGTSSPLKFITIYDWSYDDVERTILATRIPTLKEVDILTSFVRDESSDTWILPLLKDLVDSKSKVEKISLPEYAVTTRVLRTLSNLSELRKLDVVKYFLEGYEYFPSWDDEDELQSRIPRVNIEVREELDCPYYTYCDLQEKGIL